MRVELDHIFILASVGSPAMDRTNRQRMSLRVAADPSLVIRLTTMHNGGRRADSLPM
jgi:hypothetical protein